MCLLLLDTVSVMMSDDDDVFVLSSETFEYTKSIINNQAMLQKDINDLKRSVASMANQALQEDKVTCNSCSKCKSKCSCEDCSKLSAVSYEDEVS